MDLQSIIYYIELSYQICWYLLSDGIIKFFKEDFKSSQVFSYSRYVIDVISLIRDWMYCTNEMFLKLILN